MDMKKILQAFDGASDKKPVEGSSDMKQFMNIVEGRGPLNRLTQAESIAIIHQETPKKNITNPVLNIPKDSKPSMIGKYFKKVEEELIKESEENEKQRKEKATKLAEKIKYRMYSGKNGQLSHHMKQSHSMHPDIIKTGIAGAARYLARESTDEVDTVTLDIPLMIRLLEYAKEDAKTDMDLHNVAEKLIGLSKNNEVLSMDEYDAIVGEQKSLPAPEELQSESLETENPCWKEYKPVGTKKKNEKTVPNCVPKKNK